MATDERAMTLHERVVAAVEARLAVAQAAPRAAWNAYVEGGDDGWAVESDDGESGFMVGPEDIARFIADNDPARIIRDCRRDLKVLARHAPTHHPAVKAGQTGGWVIHSKDRPAHDVCDYDDSTDWPCPDVLDLAEAYEVPVNEQETP
jgi:hypothetical protein